MLEDLWQQFSGAVGVGVEPKELGTVSLLLRALLIYFTGLILVRLGQTRFLGKNTAFDVILGFVLASALSRAINGSAPIAATIAAAALLVGVHWLLSRISFYSSGFGSLLKGDAQLLIKNGEVLWDHMRKGSIGEGDLREALHLQKIRHLDEVELAWLERNGNISVIAKSREPRIIEVAVEAGVQTVRIQVD